MNITIFSLLLTSAAAFVAPGPTFVHHKNIALADAVEEPEFVAKDIPAAEPVVNEIVLVQVSIVAEEEETEAKAFTVPSLVTMEMPKIDIDINTEKAKKFVDDFVNSEEAQQAFENLKEFSGNAANFMKTFVSEGVKELGDALKEMMDKKTSASVKKDDVDDLSP